MISFARRFFFKYPFLANSIAYGTLYVSAEFSQQLLVKKVFTTEKQNLDLPTLGRYAIMGTFIYSPTLYTWYKWLDNKYPGTTGRIIIKKLILDQFLLTPVLLIMFYTGMSLMERAENPFNELKEKFIPTFIRSCAFWLPAQSINFLFVSPKFRVIYVGTCAFVWVNILCWIKRERLSQQQNYCYQDESQEQQLILEQKKHTH